MKSLLAQATSVSTAVEKAWEKAGKPSEFSIKVLDQGARNFFGMSKRHAVVSIMYQNQKPRPERHFNKPVEQKRTHYGEQRKHKEQHTSNRPRTEQNPVIEKEYWREDLLKDITVWIEEIGSLLKIPTTITTKIDKKTVILAFQNDIMPRQEEERLLFSGLSYLLIQFLKKKHKKKLQGYRLIITSKRFLNRNN